MSYQVRTLERSKTVSVVWEADTSASMPPATVVGSNDKCITLDDGALWLRDGREWVNVTVTGAAAGGSAWGAITGTLSAQTDLQSALDLKAASVHTHVESDITGLVSDLGLKAPLASPTFSGTVSGVTKAMVGLGSVDNTTDAGKPVSTAQQTALDLKANLASPAFSGTVTGVSKSMVGLGSVDNTSDAGKPVSTAQQTALDLKAPLASPAFTGTPTGITKAHVGLGSVDNTSDAGKPVSTAQQTALDLKLGLGIAELLANKNGALGYAGLSVASKLTGSQQAYGSIANTACEGNDSRLSDSRAPTAHVITGAAHTFPGGTTTFLRADGTFQTVTATAAPGWNLNPAADETLPANTSHTLNRRYVIALGKKMSLGSGSIMRIL